MVKSGKEKSKLEKDDGECRGCILKEGAWKGLILKKMVLEEELEGAEDNGQIIMLFIV